jgi:hypothetical protein
VVSLALGDSELFLMVGAPRASPGNFLAPESRTQCRKSARLVTWRAMSPAVAGG